jgi:hypothetical protein
VSLADPVPDPGGDAGGGVEAGVLRFCHEGTDKRDASEVAGCGVVYPIVVVGEAEVAQAAGDAGCVGAEARGRRRLIGCVAAFSTLGKISDPRDVLPRSLADVGGGHGGEGGGGLL